jgi:hypothetical protein
MLSLPDDLLFAINMDNPSIYHSLLLTCKQIASMYREHHRDYFTKSCKHEKIYRKGNDAAASDYDLYDNCTVLPNKWLHSINDMPAVDRTLVYCERGILETWCLPNPFREVSVKIWYNNNKIHRSNGPALIVTCDYVTLDVWYNNNNIHRVGDPAIYINVPINEPTTTYPPELKRLFDNLTTYNTDLAPRDVLKHMYDMVYTGKICSNVCYEDGVQIHKTPRKSWAAREVYDADGDEKLIAGLLSELSKPKIYNSCEEAPRDYDYFRSVVAKYPRQIHGHVVCPLEYIAKNIPHLSDQDFTDEDESLDAKFSLKDIDKDYYEFSLKNIDKHYYDKLAKNNKAVAS